ncbi:MAG: TIGR02710 family CRISPR-associated CARF protein, partial [Methanosarcinales archaeon]
ESIGEIDYIIEETGLKPHQYSMDVAKCFDVSDVYSYLKRKWIEWGKRKNIAVDLTCGRMSLVGGASVAGAFLGFDLIYVDNGEYIDSINRYKPGTEKIVFSKNPFDVFGDLHYEKVVELFNKHDYLRATDILKKLQDKVSSPKQYILYEILKNIANGYEHWNRFDYKNAKNKIKNALDKAYQYISYNNIDTKSLSKNLEVLSILEKNRTKTFFELLKEDEFSLHLMVDLYCNGIRKASQGYYEDAIVRHYRVLELISQYKLAKKDIDTKDVNKHLIPQNVREEYKRLTSEIYGSVCDIPNRVALMNGYTLLTALGKITNQDLKDINDAINPRNTLMIEHGNELAYEKTYKKFHATVRKYLEKTVGKNLEKYIKEHTFIKLE